MKIEILKTAVTLFGHSGAVEQTENTTSNTLSPKNVVRVIVLANNCLFMQTPGTVSNISIHLELCLCPPDQCSLFLLVLFSPKLQREICGSSAGYC